MDLGQLQQDIETDEEVDEAIKEELSKVTETMAKGKITENKVKETHSLCKRPSDCEVRVPSMNPAA